MSISFPTSPTPGQIYQNWVWNATAGTWDAVSPGLTLQLRKQIFTASGSYTPSPGMFQADVEVLGGGGGGGGSNGAPSTSGNMWCASGGAAGGYSRRLLTSAQIGASQTVTIGAGGTAGPNSAAAAGAGGNSSFGSLVTANGGAGGAWAQSTLTVPLGGAAGIGDIALAGENSPGGAMFNAPTQGAQVTYAGAGANSPYGTGGPGQGYYDSPFVSTGRPGKGYGSGGGGACVVPASSATTGAAGQPGLCIVTEYCWITQAAVAAQAASGARVLLMAQTVSTPVASVDFTTGIDTTYDEYVLEINNAQPSASNYTIIRVATGGVFDTGSNYNALYEFLYGDGASAPGPGGGTTSQIYLTSTVYTAAPLMGVYATVRLFRPWDTVNRRYMMGESVSYNGSPVFTKTTFAGTYTLLNAINGIRFAFLTGNVIAGTFKLYGIQK